MVYRIVIPHMDPVAWSCVLLRPADDDDDSDDADGDGDDGDGADGKEEKKKRTAPKRKQGRKKRASSGPPKRQRHRDYLSHLRHSGMGNGDTGSISDIRATTWRRSRS